MIEFPKELPQRAYRDVLEIYNTKTMTNKYVKFYKSVMK